MYRLKEVLRQAGRKDELAGLKPRIDAIGRFPDEIRGYFDRISALPDLGLYSQPEVFARVADCLRGVGREDEARGWDSLARTHRGGSP